VSVIDAVTNTVVTTIAVGSLPVSFGNFISKYTNSVTGISSVNNDAAEISIYPNPFTSKTIIFFPEEQKNITLKITDVLGNEIKAVSFSGKQFTLDKGDMTPGIYVVQITDENNKVENKKIVVE
jgi:hypothetical protein